MAVRNFWLSASNDRNGQPIATGPRGKDEGMEIKLQQRANGDVTTALRISCHADDDGTLRTSVLDAGGIEVFTFTTQR